jgi:hypothetical protein
MGKLRMLPTWLRVGLLLLEIIYMIDRSNFLTIFFVILALGIPALRADLVDEISRLDDIRYVGVSIPFQSPPSLTFKFQVKSGFLDILLVEQKNQKNIQDLFVKLNSTTLKIEPRSVRTQVLSQALNNYKKNGLFEAESHDARLLIESIKLGTPLNAAQLNGISDPLVVWAQIVRSGKNRLFRINFRSDHQAIEWSFFGNLYSWKLQHMNGSLMLILNGQESKPYLVESGSPIREVILVALGYLEGEVNSDATDLFDEESVRFFGPISKGGILAEIANIRSILGLTKGVSG